MQINVNVGSHDGIAVKSTKTGTFITIGDLEIFFEGTREINELFKYLDDEISLRGESKKELEDKIEELENELHDAKGEIEDLKEEIETLETEISELKAEQV